MNDAQLSRTASYGALVVLVVIAGGCGPSLYRQWGGQLNELARTNRRPEDVSMLLGTPPSRCEPINNPSPVIGAQVDENRVVTSVAPNGPAQIAGLRPGDRFVRVNDQPISDRTQIVSAIRDSRADAPITFETQRGVVSVIPRFPKAEQCYWDVQAGRVARAGGSAVVNQYGGSAGASGAAYPTILPSVLPNQRRSAGVLSVQLARMKRADPLGLIA